MIPPTLLKELPPPSLDLAPEDWLWATWRERKPLPCPEPSPFDEKEAFTRLTQVSLTEEDWTKAKISVSLSPQEAHFWFAAMTYLPANQTFTGRFGLEEIRLTLAKYASRIRAEIMLPLRNLLQPEDLLDLLLCKDKIPLEPFIKDPDRNYTHDRAEYYRNWLLETLVLGFVTYVWPYLTELETLRARLRPGLDMSLWPTSPHYSTPLVFRLAALLGMPEVIETGVKQWPDGYADASVSYYYQQPHQVIFGLGSASLLEAEVRRLQLHLATDVHVRAWLAHTELSRLDLIRDSILKANRKENAEAMIKAFSLVRTPEAVPPMLMLMTTSKVSQVARQWLEAHPEYTVAGSLALAAEGAGLAGPALGLLNRLKQKGYRDMIQAYLEHFSRDMAERIRVKLFMAAGLDYPPFDRETTPEWLRQALPAPKKKDKTGWADPALLPPVVVGQRCLNEAQVAALLQQLKASSLTQPAPAVLAALKQHAEPASLSTFAWRLFELWLQEGGAAKDKWALNGVGLLGAESAALKLAQLVRVKINENQSKRTQLVERCLKAICSDVSLMQFEAIAQKTKFKGLQAQAREAIEAIARERGLSRDQLEDRLVPDCGLDAQGRRIFTFGSRRFHFVFGPDLKPMLRDEKGKLQANLPKPTLKDDPVLADQAQADWQKLKKELRQVVKLQTARLEEALVSGRRWPVADFSDVLTPHPLLIHLVRLLLWGGYDAAGKLVTTFRVSEDQSYASVEDEPVSLAGLETVGLVHPLSLPEELKSAWGEIFSDYELVPPFPQLGREVYSLEEEELQANEITRFARFKVPAISLVSLLERAGWVRGMVDDGGVFDEHARAFAAMDITAVIRYEGIYAGDVVGWGDQSIERCFFVRGSHTPRRYWGRHEERLPLAEIDPTILSEVLRDLTIVAGKAK